MIEITTLSVDCEATGKSKISVFCRCYSPAEVSQLANWLCDAEKFMDEWRVNCEIATAGKVTSINKAKGN